MLIPVPIQLCVGWFIIGVFRRTAVGSRRVIKQIGWVSLGLTVAAMGLMIGREIRGRYAFNHRSPYDFYGHAGDEFDGAEAGFGV